MRHATPVCVLTTAACALALVGCSSSQPVSSSQTLTSDTSSTSRTQQVQPQISRSSTNAMTSPAVDPDYRFYSYYPAQEVYFSQRSGMFFWQSSGEWKSGSALPSHIRIDENNKVQLPLYTDTPYKLHASITARFPRSFAASSGADY